MLSINQLKQFYDDGFIVVKDVIPQSKLPEYKEAYERMVEKVRANPSRQKYNTRLMKKGANPHAEDSEDDCWGCDFLLHPDLYETAFTDYLNNEKLLSSLASILGDDLRVSGLKAIWSPLHTNYDLIWHRDGPKSKFSEEGAQQFIQFNTALYRDESFRVVRGSHRRPLTSEEDAQYGVGVQSLTDEIVCVLEPGDAMFMHAAILHRGMAPTTTKRRTLHYIIAQTAFPVGTKRLQQFQGWYEQLNLAEKLEPAAKKLFDNFFSWEGKSFDDYYYPEGSPYK